MPQYKEGDTQATMNEKALNAIGNTTQGRIPLVGSGGNVTVGYDHTIRNAKEANDCLVLGNAFENSSEPGIIQVAYDVNQNGQPDEEEWFEIAGSAHHMEVMLPWASTTQYAMPKMPTISSY